ncbi:MAG TPA: ABC transporter permease [Vicinamibacterales bacterium]|nr:ABC transporter permease [Vicinamibacterales bacterium]
MSARPSRLMTRLLQASLPAREQDEIIGDLEEDFQQLVAARGRWKAHAWYAAQAMRLVLGSHPLRRGVALETEHTGVFADLGGDLRLAVRTIRRSPGLTAIALLSLAVSLGIATAVFSIIRSVLLQPLPITTIDRVVRLSTSPERWQAGPARIATIGGSPPPAMLNGTLIGAWLEQPGSLEAIATYQTGPRTVVIGGEAVRAIVCSAGAAFFQVLPVSPVLGRTLQAADGAADAARVAVVSERLLTERQIDARTVVGRTFVVENVPHEIVGVLPRDFAYPDLRTDLWVVDRIRWPSPFEPRKMGRFAALTLGLLRAGASAADAEREGQRLAETIVAAGGSLSLDDGVVPRVSVTSLPGELLQPVRPALTLIVVGTVAVLIAANVNLAGFLLSRHAARRRDLAMRQALGATRWRLIRPLVVEQMIVGAMAAFGALLMAALVIRLLPLVAPHDLPRLSAIRIDLSSLIFAVGAAFVTALFVGLLPARRLVGGALRTHLAGGAMVAGASRGAERMRRWLVTVQVGVATLLLVGAAIVGRSLLAMMQIDLGYDPTQVITFQIGTPEAIAYGTRGRLTRLYDELLARLRAHPGVVSAGTSTGLPLHGDTIRSGITIPGVTPPRAESEPRLTTHFEDVDASYLQTIGATLVAGRFFSAGDVKSAMPVAIVNEAFVRTFMPGVEPIGQWVPRGVHRPIVVGVIKTIQRAAATNADDPTLYIPAAQSSEQVAYGPGHATGVAVRITGSPNELIALVRRVVRELEPDAPVYNVMALDQRVGRTYAQPRFFAVTLALFSTLALATALMGLYSILAAVVERRRVEVGVRRALGATGGDVAALVLGEAARLSIAGVLGGSLAAAAAVAVGRATLFGVSPADAVSYALAAGSVLAVVVVAAWVPMRSAMRVDPAKVLRAD